MERYRRNALILFIAFAMVAITGFAFCQEVVPEKRAARVGPVVYAAWNDTNHELLIGVSDTEAPPTEWTGIGPGDSYSINAQSGQHAFFWFHEVAPPQLTGAHDAEGVVYPLGGLGESELYLEFMDGEEEGQLVSNETLRFE